MDRLAPSAPRPFARTSGRARLLVAAVAALGAMGSRTTAWAEALPTFWYDFTSDHTAQIAGDGVGNAVLYPGSNNGIRN